MKNTRTRSCVPLPMTAENKLHPIHMRLVRKGCNATIVCSDATEFTDVQLKPKLKIKQKASGLWLILDNAQRQRCRHEKLFNDSRHSMTIVVWTCEGKQRIAPTDYSFIDKKRVKPLTWETEGIWTHHHEYTSSLFLRALLRPHLCTCFSKTNHEIRLL